MMKKLIAIFTATLMVLSLAACSGSKPAETTAATQAATTQAAQTTEAPAVMMNGVMSYAEFVAAPVDTPVTIVTYVQDHQSWWENKITCYTQDKDGAYFLYEMPCSEEDSKKLVPGTKILVNGYKSEWSGEVEVIDSSFEFVNDGDTYIAEAVDVTNLIGTDKLADHMNQKVTFKNVTIESDPLFKWDGSGVDGDDLYFDVSYNGSKLNATVESYLRGKGTEVYEAVKGLKKGDVVDMEGYLYWYEGANPHIISVVKK